MAPDVMIIGTAHTLQTGHKSYSSEHHKQFRALLTETCSTYGIVEIVEELSDDILNDFGVEHSIGWCVAASKELGRRYIDLNTRQRCELGLDRWSLHQVKEKAGLNTSQRELLEKYCGILREHLWVTRILDSERWPILFICG